MRYFWIFDNKFFPYGVNDWYTRKAMQPEIPVSNFADTFFPAMALVNKNKITDNKNNEIPGWNFDRDVAIILMRQSLVHG